MKIIAAILFSLSLASVVHAQTMSDTTNSLMTKIEMLEGSTNAIIVRGYGEAGTVSVGSGAMVFQLKESFDVNSGARLQGLALEFTQGAFHRREVIDYDELALLLKALDAIMSVNHSVTQLPNFAVAFRTKSGMQVIGVGNQRQSYTQTYLQFGSGERIAVNSPQVVQLRAMIANCKTALEALQSGK